jgi:hypothetical protein
MEREGLAKKSTPPPVAKVASLMGASSLFLPLWMMTIGLAATATRQARKERRREPRRLAARSKTTEAGRRESKFIGQSRTSTQFTANGLKWISNELPAEWL